jgi:hypothetical protein
MDGLSLGPQMMTRGSLMISSYAFDQAITESYLDFVYDLYRDDREWIPPDRAEYLAQFAPDFPFYRRPGNHHRHFVARSDNRVVGHLMAMINQQIQDPGGTPIGMVGFYDSIADPDVATALLGTATDWLCSSHGCQHVWGPINFDIWHGHRFLVHGFDQRRYFGEPYNKPYYPEQFEAFGFRVLQRWTSLEIDGREALQRILARSAERLRRLTDAGYRFVSGGLDDPDRVMAVHRILDISSRDFTAYTPLPSNDFQALYETYAALLGTRFVDLAYEPGGEAVALSLAYPDLAAACRAMGGRRHLLARLRFLWRRGSADRAVYHMVGAVPEELARRHGIGSAMFHNTIRRILDAGYTRIVFALIADDSPARGLLRDDIAQAQRAYALFEWTG